MINGDISEINNLLSIINIFSEEDTVQNCALSFSGMALYIIPSASADFVPES